MQAGILKGACLWQCIEHVGFPTDRQDEIESVELQII